MCFDKSTKLHFRQVEDSARIKFGTSRDNDPAHNIRSGHLKLQGETLAMFFQSSIDYIIDVIIQHRWDHGIDAVFLVGGFAASDWLFKRVRAIALDRNIEVSRPASQSNKAVADGAASFYVDHFVSTRVSKFHYGVGCSVLYDPREAGHRARQDRKYINLAGDEKIPDAFTIILPKDSVVNEEKEFYRSLHQLGEKIVSLGSISVKIYRYRGTWNRLKWMDQDPDNLEVMCTVQADTSVASAALLPLQRRTDGQTYYELQYKLILLFGLTEFKAQICWEENGVEKRSPARVIYETK
ncbi:hypothetical protein BDN72DRAFT_902220 [Pluteus cervinus]|uniref:Uncharacterized protein n=1 Tax=Pluteus cervinus TaxID=181527 RepID=A0ACD3ADB7_9AGAR|nr:hypothetical protein BDN72DRAFT_902220 [Pluteus cervinus]